MQKELVSTLKGNYQPDLLPNEETIKQYLAEAQKAVRLRTCINLHKEGDELNRTFNFLSRNTFMKPHKHDEEGMIEEIRLVRGKIRIYYFDKNAKIERTILMDKPGEFVHVPNKKIHTYSVISDTAITYETMTGIYAKDTWKKFPEWAKYLNEEGIRGEKHSEELKEKEKGQTAFRYEK
ncbi:cupin fold metalloprotein, WbuC family [Synechococcus sp. HB1133]|uniref:WbuC family cupin fold metalloprotein n=1 Tax=unclassified Synechococcus TaxID=2626047 RepID=UPI00140E876D|nr:MULTISPECIES: WbuC family cupin fold metalloprotein [unclassified Synechococcus]MCB4421463.1 cupin fold metalloprotein, WbuC family [Synechococcus sp. HB1133]MCB4431186.1 cupin fold metalloprotein, WbuC family [Synechococcus sp. HBA1120]NHI80405.1 cupin fold metalloprotein, WbuC family [Synechococcus sp. HB1133]